jgi:hypothetical protein
VNPDKVDFLNLSELLNSHNEVKCQDALSALCGPTVDYGLLDGHSGETLTYCYSRDMTVNGQNRSNVTPLSAQIDLLSSRGPIFLEIKAAKLADQAKQPQLIIDKDRKLLVQILTRIYRLRGTYGQLKKFVGFAATSRTAWCFVFSREEEDDSDSSLYKESLDIWRIDHQSLFPIWGSVATAASADLCWYLTPDAPFINSALMKLGYHPSLCGVKLENNSNHCCHKVYHLSLPQQCRTNTNNHCVIAIPVNEIAFTIKVHLQN